MATSDDTIPSQQTRPGEAGTGTAERQRVVISATFTAEPLEETLAFWAHELGMASEIVFTPYHQVFQQLLDPTSLLAQNRRGVNVILVRFEDWQRDQGGALPDDAELRRHVNDLAQALRSAVARSSAPHLLALCPARPAVYAHAGRSAQLAALEQSLASMLADVSNLYLVTPGELFDSYPVADYYDQRGDEIGHIPFTAVFFAALGTMIARKLYAWRAAPYKVIALDCDQTLWTGVCGEDGALGITIDAPRRALQQFIVRQHEIGRLICLCSKNNEEDVAEVFARRTEMPLRRAHLTSWRINWRPKSENLRALAEELRLGLDSFIFLEDSPLECAEVRAGCPAALTLQLPADPARIPQFLAHVWAFDYLNVTDEDRRRSALYRQNAQRERFRAESLSFEVFLAELELEITIFRPEPPQLARVAQLTQRTNQFNATTIRRSEGDIQQLLGAGEAECLAVQVQDRFGDYGLVGVMIFRAVGAALSADTFLLSCRALGRGVEHRMVSRMGEIALERGLARVEIPFVPSGKNQPVGDFLQLVGVAYTQPRDAGALFAFPAAFAATLTYHAPQAEPGAVATPAERDDLAVAAVSFEPQRMNLALVSKIAGELYDAKLILATVEARNQRTRGDAAALAAPRTPIEQQLAAIWAQLLGVDRVGRNDHFFKLGGHSLLGARLIARVCDAFKVDLSLQNLFQAPTVAELSDVIEQQHLARTSEEDITEWLDELDGLSDEEIQALLSSEGASVE